MSHYNTETGKHNVSTGQGTSLYKASGLTLGRTLPIGGVLHGEFCCPEPEPIVPGKPKQIQQEPAGFIAAALVKVYKATSIQYFIAGLTQEPILLHTNESFLARTTQLANYTYIADVQGSPAGISGPIGIGTNFYDSQETVLVSSGEARGYYVQDLSASCSFSSIANAQQINATGAVLNLFPPYNIIRYYDLDGQSNSFSGDLEFAPTSPPEQDVLLLSNFSGMPSIGSRLLYADYITSNTIIEPDGVPEFEGKTGLVSSLCRLIFSTVTNRPETAQCSISANIDIQVLLSSEGWISCNASGANIGLKLNSKNGNEPFAEELAYNIPIGETEPVLLDVYPVADGRAYRAESNWRPLGDTIDMEMDPIPGTVLDVVDFVAIFAEATKSITRLPNGSTNGWRLQSIADGTEVNDQLFISTPAQATPKTVTLQLVDVIDEGNGLEVVPLRTSQATIFPADFESQLDLANGEFAEVISFACFAS